MKSCDIIVAGGGFAGIYAAWRLARDGASVALLEASDGLGGNLRSRGWGRYRLDAGTHTLDLGQAAARTFYTDVLGDELRILDAPCWASTLGATWTAGFERPDFAPDAPDLAALALTELGRLEAATAADVPVTPDTGYLDWYRSMHGHALADAIEPMVRKVSGSDPALLSVDARDALDMFSRPKLGDDDRMVELKASGDFWNARVGVTLDCGDPRFTGVDVRGRIGYPRGGAMLRLCELAERRLRELGVEVVTGAAIERVRDDSGTVTVDAGGGAYAATALLWTLPDNVLAAQLGLSDRTRDLAVPVGTALFAFEVDRDSIVGPDYLTDYSPARSPFRYNRLGSYGGQVTVAGLTPVMAEVPCHPARLASGLGSDAADAAWAAMLDCGFLRADARRTRQTAWGVPVAYALPRPGWRSAHEALRSVLRRRLPGALTLPAGSRGRGTFVAYYERDLHEVLRQRCTTSPAHIDSTSGEPRCAIR